MTSSITRVLAPLRETVVAFGIYGTMGYLCAHSVKHIDPRVGFVCGATAGGIISLFNTKESSILRKIVATAAVIFVPFKVCQKLNLPITFKITLLLTGASIVASIASITAFNYINRILRIENKASG